jgi:hypothetical protein
VTRRNGGIIVSRAITGVKDNSFNDGVAGKQALFASGVSADHFRRSSKHQARAASGIAAASSAYAKRVSSSGIFSGGIKQRQQ